MGTEALYKYLTLFRWLQYFFQFNLKITLDGFQPNFHFFYKIFLKIKYVFSIKPLIDENNQITYKPQCCAVFNKNSRFSFITLHYTFSTYKGIKIVKKKSSHVLICIIPNWLWKHCCHFKFNISHVDFCTVCESYKQKNTIT